MPELRQVACDDGLAELVHLNAMVVDVELFIDLVAGMLHELGHGGAERGPATVAHVHGARRVGRDVFDQHLAHAFGNLALTVVGALGAHVGDDVLERPVLQIEVDEAGPCDLDLLDEIGLGQRIDDRLGDLARVLMSGFGAAQRDRRGPIAVPDIARAFEENLRNLFELDGARGNGCTQGRLDELTQILTWLHGRSLSQIGGRRGTAEVAECGILPRKPLHCSIRNSPIRSSKPLTQSTPHSRPHRLLWVEDNSCATRRRKGDA